MASKRKNQICALLKGIETDESAALYSNEAFNSLSKTALNPSGVFVQWDWQSEGEKSDFGLSEEEVISAYEKSGLSQVAMTQAFSLSGRNGSIPVLIAMAKNA